MQTKRPGEASVQYGDVRGEAAADMADDLGSLEQAASMLGFKVKGTIVGISMFGSSQLKTKVLVTVQVFDGSWKEIKTASDASGGTLDVTEHDREVPLAKFVKCFKRLKVSLFTRDSDIRELRITQAEED